MLVPEDDDGPPPRGGEVCQPDRLVGEFDADNPRTLFSMQTEPRDRVPAGPVHARRTPKRIALVQRLWRLISLLGVTRAPLTMRDGLVPIS